MKTTLALLSTILLALLFGCGKPQPTQPTAPTTPPPTPPTTQVNKKAVIVGINKYPGAPLNGCVNDANDITSYLKSNYQFKDSDITLLLDEKATTQNINDALAKLVANVEVGNIRIFWYSGHGAEYAGSDVSQQPDGKNQVICPVDFDWSEAHMIMDVQFNKLFGTMPNGVIFNWGSDSCHAGDLTKEIKPGKTWKRYPIVPKNIATQLAKVKKSRGFINGELEVGYISGCRFDQTSADTSSNGRPCGAMTNAFLTAMNSFNDKPLIDLVTQMNIIMNDPDQQPQAEGSRKNKPFLK
jgi:hypothetical protein